jgi:hypothetical protein
MTASDKRLLGALEANWQAEMEGHYTYSALARKEADPRRRNALRGLATAEKHHADLWAGRIRELGEAEPKYAGDLSGQADSLANRVGELTLLFAGWRSPKVGISPNMVSNSRRWGISRA